jgi:hypothetical protein
VEELLGDRERWTEEVGVQVEVGLGAEGTKIRRAREG